MSRKKKSKSRKTISQVGSSLKFRPGVKDHLEQYGVRTFGRPTLNAGSRDYGSLVLKPVGSLIQAILSGNYVFEIVEADQDPNPNQDWKINGF